MLTIKRTLEYIRQALSHVKAIETALIASAIWWAFILAMPIDTFGSSPSYQAMAGIAREEVWSSIFFVIAIVMLYSMICDKYRVRILSLILSNGLWIFVSAMFAIGNLATTGTGIYFIVACLNAYVVYKVGEQRGR